MGEHGGVFEVRRSRCSELRTPIVTRWLMPDTMLPPISPVPPFPFVAHHLRLARQVRGPGGLFQHPGESAKTASLSRDTPFPERRSCVTYPFMWMGSPFLKGEFWPLTGGKVGPPLLFVLIEAAEEGHISIEGAKLGERDRAV